MYQDYRIIFAVILLALLLPGSNTANAAQSDMGTRWYSQQQASEGMALFRTHCATCHGQNAESTPNWKQPGSDGHYPPPPLNGSAHTWHHDLPLLRKTIREGGQRLGGVMPPFAHLLNAQQIDAIIAHFQSLWPEDTYGKWATRFNVQAQYPSTEKPPKNTDIPDTSYLQRRLGDYRFDKARETPVPGIFEIRFGDKILYLSRDGQFAFIGEMIDLKNGINLSQQKPE